MSTQETNRIAELERKNADLVTSIEKVCEEWRRQKRLFPNLQRDGWMEAVVAEAQLFRTSAANHQEQKHDTDFLSSFTPKKIDEFNTGDRDLDQLLELTYYIATSAANMDHVLLWLQACEALVARLAASQSSPVVPEGFRLVPAEPTLGMWEAAGEVIWGNTLAKAEEWAKVDKFESCADEGVEAYKAMLAAAPSAPVETREAAAKGEAK